MTAPPGHATEQRRTSGSPCAIVRCLYGPKPEHRARDVLASVLAWIGLKDDVFEAELAVDELVTNARLHAPPPYELRVYLSPVVKIAVVDGGTDHAELARHLARTTIGQPTTHNSGRGLQLVAGLFPNRCGAEPTTSYTGLDPAKQVWICLAGAAIAVDQ